MADYWSHTELQKNNDFPNFEDMFSIYNKYSLIQVVLFLSKGQWQSFTGMEHHTPGADPGFLIGGSNLQRGGGGGGVRFVNFDLLQ